MEPEWPVLVALDLLVTDLRHIPGCGGRLALTHSLALEAVRAD